MPFTPMESRAQILICLQKRKTMKGQYLPMRKMMQMKHTVRTVYQAGNTAYAAERKRCVRNKRDSVKKQKTSIRQYRLEGFTWMRPILLSAMPWRDTS
ncbi:hypothetical protein MIR68_012066 [Amoeboaphelidium protococcarum]|nr:hypothetical protein MIR68_012066 [Amoeboaphelidium protococcarum]